MGKIDKYTYGFIGATPYDFSDKGKCINNHVSYMLTRTQSMFKYTNLPDTIPVRSLELYLQTRGHVCIYKHEGKLYALTGGLGGTPDVYYMPTNYVISNPALNLTVTAEIDKDCIVIPSDPLYLGLIPLFERYATGLTENELSMRIASINLRATSVISASDDRTLKSAEKYIKDLEDGKISIIGENAFLDGVKIQPSGANSSSNIMTNLIEYEQYLKASWFNEIGLQSNYNMKRETINSNESQMNDDMLLPLIDEMLKCRKQGIEKVNDMFGTNIQVSLDSSWDNNEQEINNNLSGQPENKEEGE